MIPATAITLGVDLGTTTSKVLACLDDGRPVCTVHESTVWATSHDGHTQTDPETLLQLTLTLVRRVVNEAERILGAVHVRAIGFTGLAESGVLLGSSGAPIAPVIAWFDTRGTAEIEALASRHPEFPEAFSRASGLPWDCQSSVAKLAFLKANGTRIVRGARWLSVQEWIAFSLGSDQVREPSLASRTGLIDQATGAPWAPVFELVGLPSDILPPVRRAGDPTGFVRHADLPLSCQGAVLTVAGHDHPVGAIGAGALGRDSLFNSSGTADVVLRSLPGRLDDDTRAELVRASWSVGEHVIPDTTLLLGGVRGGLLLRRVLALLGVTTDEQRADLDERAARVGALPAGLVLSGTGQTGNDVSISLGDDAGPAEVWAAATRLTAGNLGMLLSQLEQTVGPHRSAVAAGGWTRMESVRQAKRAVISNVTFSTNTQPGVTGAALIAEHAASTPLTPLAEFIRLRLDDAKVPAIPLIIA
jgi:sugar (pentulose or hexulose) kinase